MTTGYYVEADLAAEESTRRFISKPLSTDPPQFAVRECFQEGYYKFVIRKRGSRGWVFRFAELTPDIRVILDALNGVPAEVAA